MKAHCLPFKKPSSKEWMVREDSALAYRLQNEEFTDHLSGNRFRNAVVREDFPRAKNEQQKEQEMAEQAAAIYHRMLQEQEEHDIKVRVAHTS